MTDQFFQNELNILKDLATEFAIANPALAPLLEKPMTDPDVERLLEATAFQNAMLRRKLDVDFPELINKLTHLILPHYLRPIPASTIIAFDPKPDLMQSALIPAGTQIASAPVDGTACVFTTTGDVEVHPLELTDVNYLQRAGRADQIQLSLMLHDLPLQSWQPGKLRLFINGDQASASDLYLLLSCHVSGIKLTAVEGGACVELPPECLRPAGFTEDDALLPYPSHAFPGYRLLQEYISAPKKFFFFDLIGWEQWIDRGDGNSFTISIELNKSLPGLAAIKRESFVLHCAPAVNIFSHQAYPISINHRVERYLVRPIGSNPAHYQILSVDGVTGFRRETCQERDYHPFELFSSDSATEPRYQAVQESSQHGNGLNVYMSVVYPGEIPEADSETLSIDLTCTNGTLPESLHIGDICIPVSDLPETISFRNITSITPGLLPSLGSASLWQLTTHLYLNHLSLERVEHLRTLLELYVFPDNRSGAAMTANLKRISGIESISITQAEEMVKGIPLKGREINIRVRHDHFAGAGDMYLFGSVLDNFFGMYASMNTFTRLTLNESMRGGGFQWPTRLGKQSLQ